MKKSFWSRLKLTVNSTYVTPLAICKLP